jgi:hypothetical protein
MLSYEDFYKYGFAGDQEEIENLTYTVDARLFKKIRDPCHCLFPLLPPEKDSYMQLRSKGHSYTLPLCRYELHKNSFIVRTLSSLII